MSNPQEISNAFVNNAAKDTLRPGELVHSRIGLPCKLAPALALPLELTKDDQYDDWVVPFSMHADVLSVFRLFRLWQSSNGLMKPGRRQTSIRGSEWQGYTTTFPVLVGDILDSRLVITSQIQRDGARWFCRVGFAPRGERMTKALTPDPEAFLYYQSLWDTDKALMEELLANDKTVASENIKLIASVVEQVLPLCVAGPYPVSTVGATALFTSLKQLSEQAVEQAQQEHKEALTTALDEQEAKQWQNLST